MRSMVEGFVPDRSAPPEPVPSLAARLSTAFGGPPPRFGEDLG